MEPIRAEHVTSICQSCGMPLDGQPLGTSAGGEPVADYCGYCFRDGHYTEPDLQKEEMIAKVASFLASAQRLGPAAAELLARRTLSGLKRWQNGAS